MKNIRTTVLCVCISIISFNAFAQHQDVPPVNEPDYNKPKMFAAFPEQIPVNLTILNNLFTASLGATVDMNIADGSSFRFAGEVVSTVSKYENKIRSVVIRSSNFNGARLSVSKITNDDGSIAYTARIISRGHGDLYELQNLNNRFILVKRSYYDVVNE